MLLPHWCTLPHYDLLLYQVTIQVNESLEWNDSFSKSAMRKIRSWPLRFGLSIAVSFSSAGADVFTYLSPSCIISVLL